MEYFKGFGCRYANYMQKLLTGYIHKIIFQCIKKTGVTYNTF